MPDKDDKKGKDKRPDAVKPDKVEKDGKGGKGKNK